MSDPKGQVKAPIGFTLLGKATMEIKGDKKTDGVLGIELPFDWCLVRGSVLRSLQKQLHEASMTAALRLRMCANLRREILRKESR